MSLMSCHYLFLYMYLQIDRTRLTSDVPCLSANDESFFETYGFEQTNNNCNGKIVNHMFRNCSIGAFFGYKKCK